jgi:hypothetical protein
MVSKLLYRDGTGERYKRRRFLPMRPKARETTQHGSPPSWVEENDPASRDLPDDGCPGYWIEFETRTQYGALPSGRQYQYTVEKGYPFSRPRRDVTDQTLPGRE